MKISNEIKVGAVAFVTIVAFIWLYSFLKGKNLLNPSGTYYVVYNEIGGLTESNPVQINGYKAGVVHSIKFLNDMTGRLLVEMSIKKGFVIPKGSVAEITAASLVAGMKIRLLFGKGPGEYNSGDTIPGMLDQPLISKITGELGPVKEKINGLITSLDTLISGINSVMTPQFRANLRGTVSNLNSATRNMNELVGAKDTGLKSTVADLSRFSKMLSDNSAKLSKTIGNMKTISDTLASADLYKTVVNLKSTLERTSVLLGKMNEGKGTAGKIATNDSLYINLNNSIHNLDLLLKDIKENPRRYINVSVFGGKK
ncbi:MAG TPA: MlaD family protein [Bacteroidales bacterium]|nr:MlaD family protein [Bacteroidales bacterium]